MIKILVGIVIGIWLGMEYREEIQNLMQFFVKTISF